MSTMSRAGTAQYVSLKDKLTYLAQQHAELTIQGLNGLPVSTMDYEPLWSRSSMFRPGTGPRRNIGASVCAVSGTET